MIYHYCDPDEPETCPNRNDILRKFDANRRAIFRGVQRPVATAYEIAVFLQPFSAREIDEVLLDALVPPVSLKGERAFVLGLHGDGRGYQLVRDFSPAAIARLYMEAHDDL